MRTLSAAAVAVAAVLASLAAPAAASVPDLAGTVEFGYSGVRAAAALGHKAPAFAGAPQDRLERVHLLPGCGDGKLVGFADSAAAASEAAALWTGILAEAGIKAVPAAYEHGVYVLPYKAPVGLVIRRFQAEPRQFRPKDEASLRENMAMIVTKLGERGHRLIAARVVAIPGLLPAYAAYYLTRKEPRQEDELQVRVLKPGEDIDSELLEERGVDILQKPETWMLVYAGREVGFVSRVARNMEEAQRKLSERIELLTGMGKTMIGSRILPLSAPFDGYTLLVNIYFYQ